MTSNVLEVCAAVVLSGDRLLLATRRPGSHLAGSWEFPGGKREAGETSEQCIQRELEEELGLRLSSAHEVFTLRHEYPGKTIRLHFMHCLLREHQVPRPREGQFADWFTPDEMAALDLAPADRNAVQFLLDSAVIAVEDVNATELGALRDWLQSHRRPPLRLPEWIRSAIPTGNVLQSVQASLTQGALHTVCQSANCPNRAECWGHRTATFLILGNHCTRDCRFCAVPHGIPSPVESDEPSRVARSVQELGLRYAVVTCVTRDDLPDGGAAQMAATVHAIHALQGHPSVEVLCSDYAGNLESVDVVLGSLPEVFGHNVETVERLTPAGRNRADYRRSLAVLAHAAERGACVKSGLMLGLGETEGEVRATLSNLRDSGVSLLTLGQYLSPSHAHWPVSRMVSPEEFSRWQTIAETEYHFQKATCGPLVRSSYRAEELMHAAQSR